ncbi:MAG: tRNA (adenosine(37)-N6)-threonylcarbamoyltransferase complex transferase subunit TsaD [Oscillospiraceae bacterium]|nr:tRNA (adenosine(37)-N6)-threonylcarbamoyltransferase complex transferase subunit TsaD [Oscillospiraceae bacterium]
MNILAIESSCDETAAAVVTNGREIRSNLVLSQIEEHAVYGGVVPEIASRRHVEAIVPLADAALKEAGLSKKEIDAVAVTYAPGLIGALLVGLNFAKSVALGLDVPLIPVHHLRGHIAANFLAFPELKPPFLCLMVSGGNTLLVDVRDYTDMVILGRTRDDAAGECFDKVARVLGYPYPGGKAIESLAKTGDPTAYPFPRANIQEAPLDMSFSGLKTAVVNLIHNAEQKGTKVDKAAVAASFQAAVRDMLIPRTAQALQQTGHSVLVAAGGVAANGVIREALKQMAQEMGRKLYLPPLALCGDNAAMIAAQGYYEYQAGHVADMTLNAYANMEIGKNDWTTSR